MGKTHDMKYEAALEAINKVMADQSASKEEIIESLTTLQSEIDIMIEALGE